MDKGKSKTDLRAAGKKRLEEFRQKKNQKGSGTTGKAIVPTTTATAAVAVLKALTESEEQGSEENSQEANSRLSLEEDHCSREERGGGSSIDSCDETLVSCTKGSEEETVILPGSSSTVAAVVDPSSPLVSPIQTARPEARLSVEASEPCDVALLSQPGSAEQEGSQCELERERKAVYTIFWEPPATNGSQTNEDWRENTYEGAEAFADKALNQGDYSTFRLEDKFPGQNRDGFNLKEHLNGVGECAEDDVQLLKETVQKDSQETPESDGFRDDGCVDPSAIGTLQAIGQGGQLSTNGEDLLKREEDALVEGDVEGLVEEQQARVLEERGFGRDLDGFRNGIEVLQSEKEVGRLQFVENADEERRQSVAEIEEAKTQMQKMVNEREQLLQAASERETLLISELRELRAAKDEESSRFVLQLSKLRQQLQELGDEKSLFAERYASTCQMLDNLHGENLRLVEESAREQQKQEASFAMELATWKDKVEGLEKERSESRGSIAELSARLQRLESDLRDVETLNSQDEKRALSARVMELNQSLRAVEDEKMQLGTELDELKDEKVESALVVEELHLRIQALEGQAATHMTEVAQLHESLKSLGDEKVECAVSLNDLIRNAECLNLRVQDLEKAVGDLESGNRTLTQELQSLGEEKAQLAKLLELSNRDTEALKLKLQGCEQEKSLYFSENEALSQELQGLKQGTLDLEKLLEDSRQELQGLKHGTIDLEKLLEDSCQELQGLKQGKIDLEKLLEASRQEIESLTSRVQGMEEDRRAYVSEEALSNRRLQSLEEEKMQLVTSLKDAGHEVDALNLRVQILQEEIRSLVSENAAGKQGLRRSEEEKIRAVELLEDSKKKAEILSLKVRKLEEEMGALQKHNLDLSEERDQLTGDLHIAKEQIRMLETKKEELGLRASKSEDDLKRIREEGQELMEQLDASRQEVTRMAEERSEREKQLAELNRGMEERWREERNELVKELEGYEQQAARLAEERSKLLEQIEISRQEVRESGCRAVESEEERRRVEEQLESEFRSVRQELQTLESEKINLMALLGSSRQELQQAVEDRGLMSVQREELSQRLRSETEEHTSAVKKLQEVFDEKEERLTSELEASQLSLQGTQAERKQAERELQLLQEKLENAAEKKDHLANELKESRTCAREKEERLTSELKVSQLSLQGTQAERKRAEHELRLLQEKLENSVDEKDRLADKLEESRMRSQDLTVGNADFLSRLEQLQEVCRKRDEENTRLQALVTELEQQQQQQQRQTSGFGRLEKGASQSLRSEKSSKDEEARSSKEVMDVLQRERDAAIQTERALRAELNILLKNPSDSDDERSNLTALLMELEADFRALRQRNAEWADQTSRDIEALKETKVQLSRFVDQLKGENASLRKAEDFLALAFAEVERKVTDEVAARLQQKETQSRSLASRLQEVETELTELKDEHGSLGEKLEASVLERRMLEESFKELQDTCAQMVKDKNTLEMLLQEEKAHRDMSFKNLKAQCTATLEAMEAKNDVLKQTNTELGSKVRVLASEVEQAASEEERLRQTMAAETLEIKTLRTENQDLLAVRDSEVTGLKQQLEEATSRSSQQDESVRALMQQQIRTLKAELSKAREDCSSARTEVAEVEKKLSNTKERLTLAISKGKSVVQQRDAVKQALKEKTEELERLISSHEESIKVKDMALHEAEAKASSMAAMAERASLLDVELAIVQDTIASLEHVLHEARSVTQDVLLKLETTGEKIPQELGTVAKIEWLAATFTVERSKAEDLANNAVTLLTELATSKQESEALAERVAELDGKCVKLEELVAEESSAKRAVASEIVVLRRAISERDSAMEAEMAAHLKLQSDISVAMKPLLDFAFPDQMFDAGESLRPSFSLELVESAIARMAEKHRTEAHKVEELAHQIAVMAQEAQTAKEDRDSSMDRCVRQMRETLDYTESELSKTMEKLREAAVTVTRQEEENRVLVQQAERMQSELLETGNENMSLQADFVITKQRLSDVRDRLLLGLAGTDNEAGDISPAQLSLAEKAGEIQALADALCVEMQKKDAALREANEKSSGMAATVASLELELDSLRRVSLGRLEELGNELSLYKEENTELVERLRVLGSEHTALGEQAACVSAERDAVKVEMSALDNAFQSNRERAHSEGYLLARSLEEALESAKLELNELSKKNTEMASALVHCDNAIQDLSQECTRLGIESAEARREADTFRAEVSKAAEEKDMFRTEMSKAAEEKDALQAELEQMEQKLSSMREKLGLAVKKGKAVEKQREALKKSLEEKTQELDALCVSYKEELEVKDAKLHESREKFQSVAEHVLELEFQLTTALEKVAATELQSVLEGLRFQQEVDGALSHIPLLPSGVKTCKVVEKIEWLGTTLGEMQSRAARSERELEVLSLKLREVHERLRFLETENSAGKETILSWARKAEEAESRAISDCAQYESELEFQSRALSEAEARTRAAVAQVEEMQGALQQKQNSLKSMEATRGKAISKLTMTLNRLTELRQQSEGLVAEIENLHGELQARDVEILGLKEKISNADAESKYQQERFSGASAEANSEILKLRKELMEVNSRLAGSFEEMASLRNDLTQKTEELEKLQKHLEPTLLKEDSSEQTEQTRVVTEHISRSAFEDAVVTDHISRSAFEDADIAATNGTSVDHFATIDTLRQRIDELTSDGQLWRVNMERKDAQLQGLREELDELVKEQALLQAGIQAKQFHIDRLQADMAVLISPGSDRTAIPAPEIEELGARSKRVGHMGSSLAAPHVRGGARKPFPAEVTIDMDGEMNPLLLDLDDKGHGFNSLTNSALVPKRMRDLADRLDGLCVVGGRLLMRQPTARLGLAVYWIAIHVYMAMIVSRAIL